MIFTGFMKIDSNRICHRTIKGKIGEVFGCYENLNTGTGIYGVSCEGKDYELYYHELKSPYIKFNSAKEMYDYLVSGNDLYSYSAGVYAFVYNDADALCYYNLSNEEVKEIVAKNTDDFWSASLGIGGYILDESEYDDDEHRYSNDEEMRNLYLQPSWDFCNEMYAKEDWLNTKDVTVWLMDCLEWNERVSSMNEAG